MRLAGFLSACAFLASGAACLARAQGSDMPVLFIESAAGPASTEIATDVILFVPADVYASSFRANIAFDPAAVVFERIEFGPAMDTNAAHLVSDGNLLIESAGGHGCPAGSSCFLATVTWTAARPGNYPLHIAEVSATNDALPLEVRSSDGALTVTAAVVPTDSRDSGLDLVNAVILGALLLLVCGVLAAPVMVFARRLRTTRTAPARPASTSLAENDLAGFVGRYLDDIQAAGTVDEPLVESDAMARAHAREDP